MDRFLLNKAGVKQMLRSGEMLSVCEEYARAYASSQGLADNNDVHVGKTRVNVALRQKRRLKRKRGANKS